MPSWVLEQMDPTVEAFHLEDTEARERCLAYIEWIFKLLGIPNDRGVFRKYMIIWLVVLLNNPSLKL